MCDKVEELLIKRCENPDMLDYFVISGSRLYGTERPDSDYDYRGILHQIPIEYLLGLKKFECYEKPDADFKVFSLSRAIHLMLRGSPEHIELLFIPESNIISCSRYMQEILDMKNEILSMRLYYSIVGYSYSEWRKFLGVKMIVDERTKIQDDVINDIRNLFHPDKLDMDKIIEILFADKPRRLVPSKANCGKKRKDEFTKYGYGATHASHSIRLLGQLLEVLETGAIIFPRPQAKVLRGIRFGEFSKDEIIEMYETLLSEVEKAKDKSVLPDKPNEEKVREKHKEILFDYLKNDKRNRELLGISYMEHI